jgi:hypothetical protein
VPYNLVQAGAAVGKSKTAILRAIRRGVISAQRDEVTGGWAIDPAELHRAFPPVTNETPRNQDVTDETGELRELRARLEAAELRIGEKDATITDLRHRLDRADSDRRQALDRLAATQERIAALLTDQRSTSPAAPIAPPPASSEPTHRWWRWR